MAHVSDPRFLVLHALRLKGFADRRALGEATGVRGARLDPILERLKGEGLVDHRQGRLTGWALSSHGRAGHAALMAADTAPEGVREDIGGAYRRFLAINADLLETCTMWQLREQDGRPVINDHSDIGYDTAVIDRLRRVHEAVRPICAVLGRSLVRLSGYGARLDAAMEKVAAGDLEWFTRPVIDSYHTVWFELHEDLLLTLGFERAGEVPAARSLAG